jgi:serine/threonine protein kinase
MAVALRVTAEVARGAAELHRAGIVHRDLKPSNVLITSTPDGPERLLIADLGVAKNLAQASGLTMSVGSAGYMAPEQSGPNSGVDVRADVYSLGAIAYRLISGEVPGLPGFVQWDLPALRDLPVPVRTALQQALEVNVERRWPDAASFAVQLDQLAGQTFSAPTEKPPRVRRPRRRMISSIAVLAVLAVLAGFGAVKWLQPVQVKDKSQRITIKVPRSWSKTLMSEGWDPGVLKLTGKQKIGLVVANDVNEWNNLKKPVNGVFIGVSDDPDLPAEVAKIDHPGCDAPRSGKYAGPEDEDTAWVGPIRIWDNCIGAGYSIREISLTLRKGDRPERVYVQIRQDGDDDATLEILDSLKITPSP